MVTTELVREEVRSLREAVDEMRTAMTETMLRTETLDVKRGRTRGPSITSSIDRDP